MPTCELLGLTFVFTLEEFQQLLTDTTDGDTARMREQLVLSAWRDGLRTCREIYAAHPAELCSTSTTYRVLAKLRRRELI